jgi:hypothetical protein
MLVPNSSTDKVGETSATSAGLADRAASGLPDAGDSAPLDERRPPSPPLVVEPPVAGPARPTPEPSDGPVAGPPEPRAGELGLPAIGGAAGDAGPDEAIGATPAAEPRDAPPAPMLASVKTAATITPRADNTAMPFMARRWTLYEAPFGGRKPQAATVAVSVV